MQGARGGRIAKGRREICWHRRIKSRRICEMRGREGERDEGLAILRAGRLEEGERQGKAVEK